MFVAELLTMFESFDLSFLLNDVITRPGLRSNGNCIDNVSTSFPSSVSVAKVIDLGFSDHLSIQVFYTLIDP